MMSKRILKAGYIGLLASMLPVGVAMAAPSVGPSGMDFYEVPSIYAGSNGDLIWYRSATVDVGASVVSKAWNVMYRSTDSLGATNTVTGTVIVPNAAWTGPGERPTLSYAVGTHGLAQGCAPSLQLAGGTDYENRNIAAALAKGYAVLVTDNAGYTTGDSPTYLAGESQAHAALDIFTAASQIPNAGISANAPAVIWGYSQGGQTASWAGEVQKSYAPDLNLVAIAAGGTPADFPSTAAYLDGSAGASFLLGAVVGLAEQYPDDIPLDELASANGHAAIAVAKDQCVFESLFDFMNDSISEYTVGSKGLTELLAISSVNDAVTAQNLGDGKPSVPVYQYHGQADEFIEIEQHAALKKRYCGKFAKVTFDIFPSEHIVTQFQAAPHVLEWFDERFAGTSVDNSCYSFSQAPKSNANPGGGDFVVSLNDWNLGATIHLATLDQDVILPEDSSLTADTNITQGTLMGSMSVPDFDTKLNILVNLDVNLSIEPVGPITGTAGLSRDGMLNIDGQADANVLINAAGFGWLKLPFNCTTTSPVAFPIAYEGPIGDLGAGYLEFNGTTEFSELKCGWMTSLFNSLVAGPGQQYQFTVTPPAPTRW
ncbi:MAG: Triacylglycerol lipase [Thalassolituus oleivorans]|uniref:lipase family protein n=1 Tax=Thalassolituus oleivorans TaxID=187493 RepID=UPI0009492678|nr:lipase family protein [Thalassolituus oleivorans]APR67010.1 Triacylglycerol lipase [Thalassolituus oleivorans]MBQ0726679.1 Triacylglycerol lipase [Thalassolituus oleivorans]MBQ0780237.1 Triacylglycerol lipase [Thalassolituus oleivorans]